ncbi:hypothetical protein JW711_04695 [Candidatus Woesearchaeota archaeon]|nr:hypothetical protein [Candidatus Woesearchaeota archaeon]
MAACDPAQAITIDKSLTKFYLHADTRFKHDFNLTGQPETGVQYAYSFIQGYLSGLQLSQGGILELLPNPAETGTTILALIAVKGECADTAILTFQVSSGPMITQFSPSNYYVDMNLTQNMTFSITAESNAQDKTLTYEWLLDGQKVSEGFPEFVLATGYTLHGDHELTGRVIDSQGLFTDQDWTLHIRKVDLSPVQLKEIPGVTLYKNTLMGAYNLRDYFYDPEYGSMSFYYKKVLPQYSNITYANVSVNIDSIGYITYYPETNSTGYAYFIFSATDDQDLTTESNIVRVDVLNEQPVYQINSTQKSYFCGDYSCNAEENCTTCPFDCGFCDKGDIQGCLSQWNCTEWIPCTPEGKQNRSCNDIHNCGDDRSMPDTERECEYIGNCTDGLQTGFEEGVDCGGPCEPCPTCYDGIMNQGEGGVDCGGPCEKRCEQCENGKKDGNETDVDCGGPSCPPCDGDKACLKRTDCISLNCTYLVCGFASCFDLIRNQGEGGVDCGGPCEAVCSNCSDGLKNGNELGVDCGGPCKPCPNCGDGVKNGDEWLVDCGGSCPRCSMSEIFSTYFFWFIGFFAVLAAAFIFVIGYFFYLLYSPEEAERLYGNNVIFVLLTELHHFSRVCRRLIGRRGFISKEDYAFYKDQIMSLVSKEAFSNNDLYELIIKVLSDMLSLPADFDDAMFYRRIRSVKVSPFIKVLLVGFYRRSTILSRDIFIPTEEQEDFVTELKFLLLELSKA